jgi:hypothetical protein
MVTSPTDSQNLLQKYGQKSMKSGENRENVSKMAERTRRPLRVKYLAVHGQGLKKIVNTARSCDTFVSNMFLKSVSIKSKQYLPVISFLLGQIFFRNLLALNQACRNVSMATGVNTCQ